MGLKELKNLKLKEEEGKIGTNFLPQVNVGMNSLEERVCPPDYSNLRSKRRNMGKYKCLSILIIIVEREDKII